MDNHLFIMINQNWASPWMDWLMLFVSGAAMLLVPLWAAYVYFQQNADVGKALIIALICSIAAALVFQLLAMRPRPESARLIIPQLGFPSYPSGHTAAAFAAAMVYALRRRTIQRWLLAIGAATIIGLSRIYLGHHYPSDVFAGAVIGISVGTATYGLVLGSSRKNLLRWFLWPQLAIILIATQMAYIGVLPMQLLDWPMSDKVAHFLLFGALAFWLNIWLQDRRLHLQEYSLPIAIALPVFFAFLDESLQYFSLVRNADLLDLLSDIAGLVCFYLLSKRFIDSSVSGGRAL